MSTKPGFESGLTLVELMVAMTISLIIGIAVLSLQGQMLKSSFLLSEASTKQNESRTALDMLSRAAASAGFGLDWMNQGCDITGVYANKTALAATPIWAETATASTLLPFGESTLGYPEAGSALPTDILYVSSSSSLGEGSSSGQTFQVYSSPQSSALEPATSAKVPLPMTSQGTSGVEAGDLVLVKTQQGASTICYQVPVVSIVQANNVALMSSMPSSGMPPTGYRGFTDALAAQGVSTALTDDVLLNATVTDLGPASAGSRSLLAFYIGELNGIPALYRAQVDIASGNLVENQPIALGAVSLQTRFIAEGETLTWPQIMAKGLASKVTSVSFALVMRTLHPDQSYTAPASISIPGFEAVPLDSQSRHYHYSVLQTTVALRNLMWGQTS